ncbi:polynucleotide kinase-phosphatase [Ferrimicrobium sp.]|uniref:polynucleotide kinase-phosphatase n=1 Tax=Ferrimicrobium sp. TaxID=2926050 RepID=UPI0026179982|nr:polynucleotide kinase-phosphatase [Ferrimicrobium sp.]
MSTLRLPDLCLVVLVGVSGSGKSTFAAQHFLRTEVVSSDFCRALVSDDENDQSATKAAFDVLDYIVEQRLELGKLTVVDATNVQVEARKSLIDLARRHHVLAVAIVLDMPIDLCVARNGARMDRQFGPHVLRNQSSQLQRSLRRLRREGFHRVYHLTGEREVAQVIVEREPVWNDRRNDHGPFDIIGDVHGCIDELVELLEVLGYCRAAGEDAYSHPEGRRVVFLGDLVDRGPGTPEVLRLAMQMVRHGSALCVSGNHEVKLLRALQGKKVEVRHGLGESLEQLRAESSSFSEEVAEFLDRLISHYVFDGGALVVAHAGLPASMHGRTSAAVRAFALYGDTSGESDEYGLPVRYPWAEDYRGSASVIYGHTPVKEPVWVNRTLCIDTGCVFGGRLTALRYPEREIVSVPAREVYYEPVKPLVVDPQGGLGREPGVLDVGDVLGKHIIETRLRHTVTIREENSLAALEVMSRFAADPRWLVYLPATMSPTATSAQSDLLESPEEAFAYYAKAGVAEVVCEEKHMGSRAVVVVFRDADAGSRRFGFETSSIGMVYTRTGRPFFGKQELGDRFLARVRAGIEAAGLWDQLATEWLILDCEILPWSFKTEDLMRRQYAVVGAAAARSLGREKEVLEAVAARGMDVAHAIEQLNRRIGHVENFAKVYQHYSWPVRSLDDLQLAPFQILAGEGSVHALKDHAWHLNLITRLAETDPMTFRSTQATFVSLGDSGSQERGYAWWEELTSDGGEGMVVKPAQVVHFGKRGLTQPALKVRGPEYLRLVYGPEYTEPQHLARLRTRSLGRKRSLALHEFSLGIEGLERFVAGEPLYRIHECAFGVLALESEEVDPRL